MVNSRSVYIEFDRRRQKKHGFNLFRKSFKKKRNRWINGCLWSKLTEWPVLITTQVRTSFDIDKIRVCRK